MGTLYVFDVDDTLFHTTAMINVMCDGNIVERLTSKDFNRHRLPSDHTYDFAEFRSADKFHNESKPIMSVIEKVKDMSADIDDNSTLIMITARADFDNKETVLNTFNRYGLDMNNIHIHRSGNLPGDDIPAVKKLVYIRRYLDTCKYNKVAMYDDSKTNLEYFLGLKHKYLKVSFTAWLVGHTGTITNYGSA